MPPHSENFLKNEEEKIILVCLKLEGCSDYLWECDRIGSCISYNSLELSSITPEITSRFDGELEAQPTDIWDRVWAWQTHTLWMHHSSQGRIWLVYFILWAEFASWSHHDPGSKMGLTQAPLATSCRRNLLGHFPLPGTESEAGPGCFMDFSPGQGPV